MGKLSKFGRYSAAQVVAGQIDRFQVGKPSKFGRNAAAQSIIVEIERVQIVKLSNSGGIPPLRLL